MTKPAPWSTSPSAKPSPAEKLIREVPGSVSTSKRTKRKFLGVNEDPQTRESLDKVLRTEDCEVRLAAGAQEGIGEFDSERHGLKEHRWVVDGERMTDPRASETAPNPSGGLNSVLKVHG